MGAELWRFGADPITESGAPASTSTTGATGAESPVARRGTFALAHVDQNPYRQWRFGVANEGEDGNMKRRFVPALAFAVTGVALVGLAVPAAAEPPEFPHGVGVCVSQVAIEPGLAGADRLGELVKSVAGPGSPGSDTPLLLADLRGDGPGGCGTPPGPGHLR